MTDELKPVPCGCGGEAKIETVTTRFEQVPRFRIRCERCNISTIWNYWSETEVITAWNKAMGAYKEFEWCRDCKEYDQEQHCCHRWTQQIRRTVEELKAQYPERMKGRWQRRKGSDCWECSQCHAVLENDDLVMHNFYFCYHCGADMMNEDGYMKLEGTEHE